MMRSMSCRFLSPIAIAVWTACVAGCAYADPNKALQVFLSACLRTDVSLKASRPAIEASDVRSASMNEALFELNDETVKATVYEVEASMINANRPYVVGCNVVAEGRFAEALAPSVETQLASLGFSKVNGRPKGGQIRGSSKDIFSVYQNNGQIFDVYVGDISFDDIGERTFLIIGLRP
jgi:hypothetical protein